MLTPANPEEYPVQLDIEYPEHLSRRLIFVKWLALVPHYVALWLLGIASAVQFVISLFAVLISGSYPRSSFAFLVGFERWRTRVNSYLLLETDAYPPFSLADDEEYPVRLLVDYPEQIARWRPLVNWLLVIPAAIAGAGIGILAAIAVVLAWFAILFTGRYPRSLFNVVTISLRWQVRITLFSCGMTAEYPPFIWA